MHDDFDGSDKNVYVENFADDPIFARVRLEEYFEIVMNKGAGDAETTETIVGTKAEDGTITYATHIFADADKVADEEGAFQAGKAESMSYWNWKTGGSAKYMPTFNKNKDSLVADINGTKGYTNDAGEADPYGDYVDYSLTENATVPGTEIYDGDSNQTDEVGTDFENLANYAEYIKTVDSVDHTVKDTGTAQLISMEDWLAIEGDYSEATHGNYWVYDTDGWCYWSSPIESDSATGLLLDGIELSEVMDDSYYYAINVVGQFITADDLGKEDNTGFYDPDAGPAPSRGALMLLEKIGVNDIGEIPATTFTTTDDMAATPYAFITKSDQTTSGGTTLWDLTFVRTFDELSENDINCTWENKQLCDVFEIDEEYSGTSVQAPWRWNTSHGYLYDYIRSVRVYNTIKPKSIKSWFTYLSCLTDVDVKKLDTSEVTDMSWLFYEVGYSSDGNCESLDLSTWDTSNVTNMSHMFDYCGALKTIDVSGWDTSNVTDMSNMFKYCKALELDCSAWNVSSVTDHSSFNENASGVIAPNWVN